MSSVPRSIGLELKLSLLCSPEGANDDSVPGSLYETAGVVLTSSLSIY